MRQPCLLTSQKYKSAENVNTVKTLNDIFELASSMFSLAIGVWATVYAYGFVGERILGRFYWIASFKNHLRWLGPLLVVITIGCLLFQAVDIAILFRR